MVQPAHGVGAAVADLVVVNPREGHAAGAVRHPEVAVESVVGGAGEAQRAGDLGGKGHAGGVAEADGRGAADGLAQQRRTVRRGVVVDGELHGRGEQRCCRRHRQRTADPLPSPRLALGSVILPAPEGDLPPRT